MAMSFVHTFAGSSATPDTRHTDLRDTDATMPQAAASATTQARSSKRATSHYNHFQTSCSTSTDDPPTYAATCRQQQRPRARQHTIARRDTLPGYSCTVAAEGKVLLQLESINPLHGIAETEWREVYMVLRGTLLSFHRPKDNGPGRLLRSYTLQHAEVGAAPDAQHTTLQPQTKLAHLIPALARQKAWKKDPSLFQPVRQHILRLRAELDQLLLADPSEERIHSFIHAISAAIDISPAIDERSIPRQCTVPRRRRRTRNHAATTTTTTTTTTTSNMDDPALIAEQERLLRDMYPAFAERQSQEPEDQQIAITRTITVESAQSSPAHEPPSTPPAAEDDELDLAVMREDFATPSSLPPPPPRQSSLPSNADRPAVSRQTTSTSVNSSFSTTPATQPTNLCPQTGKWLPPHNRSSAHMQRYIKRCMPVLLAESPRPNDIIICHGKRVKINWRMAMLDEWELKPPSYRSHKFEVVEAADYDHGRTSFVSEVLNPESTDSGPGQSDADLSGHRERAHQRSHDTSSNSGNENDSSDDHIQPAETAFAHLDLSKIPSSDANGDQKSAGERRQGRRETYSEVHGMVFCF